jgi:hypothetical protein
MSRGFGVPAGFAVKGRTALAAIIALVCGFEILIAVLLGSGFVAIFGFETVVVLVALAVAISGLISNQTNSLPDVLCRISCRGRSSLNVQVPRRTNASCVWSHGRDGEQHR